MPLSEERAIRIQLEETLNRMPETPDADGEERRFRERIQKDIAMLRRAGIEVVVPNTWPDISAP
jgi:hypothetical protein